MVKPLPRLRLQGFNNLTKALSFNIYDICYAVSEEQRQRYIEYIDEQYDADRLTQILTDVAEIIGANILNVARQDYDPQGASVTILISEEPVVEKLGRDAIAGAVVAHMDKSHITVHTYPETHPHNGIATFRADIDVAVFPTVRAGQDVDQFHSRRHGGAGRCDREVDARRQFVGIGADQILLHRYLGNLKPLGPAHGHHAVQFPGGHAARIEMGECPFNRAVALGGQCLRNLFGRPRLEVESGQKAPAPEWRSVVRHQCRPS